MTALTKDERRKRRWRIVVWGGAAFLLLLPAVAMQFTPEVTWTAEDFVGAALILGLPALAFEFLLRRGGSAAYQLGAALALGACFLLTWFNLAVGIIGSEDDPANLMFAGVITVAVGGACLARFRPAGMARAMLAAAVAELLILPVALIGRLGDYGEHWPRPVIVLTLFFTALWLAAAWLFRQAAGRANSGA